MIITILSEIFICTCVASILILSIWGLIYAVSEHQRNRENE